VVQHRRLRTAGVVTAVIVGLSAVSFVIPDPAAALCAGPKEGGRWWNTNPAGDPISVEVTLDDCGDQVLNGQQTETKYGLKVFVKQSDGKLFQRSKVRATYRTSKDGKRWLYAEVPTGGYLDHLWLRTSLVNGQTQLYAYIKHESLDSKPSAESKLWFSRQPPAGSAAPVKPTPPGVLTPGPSAGRSALSSAFTCKPPFVWREARPTDLVCVTVNSRTTVADENRNAAQGVEPGAAPNCRSGLVWREAFSGDIVCVSPQRREQVREENRVGPNLRAQQ